MTPNAGALLTHQNYNLVDFPQSLGPRICLFAASARFVHPETKENHEKYDSAVCLIPSIKAF